MSWLDTFYYKNHVALKNLGCSDNTCFITAMTDKNKSELKTKIEKFIASNPAWSFEYADIILNGRFLLGEPIITDNPLYSYFYATVVIGGEFPQGEDCIAQSPKWGFLYAYHVLNKRFPKAEASIAVVPYWAYSYAIDILNDRFLIAEPMIAKDVYWKEEYEKRFNVVISEKDLTSIERKNTITTNNNKKER